ncbi:hypothetical protein DFH28DRAFT_979765 [Melampsora americana]|nr:hypothetical protein DFH28DRAFT_979765 [Melampsora americana]
MRVILYIFIHSLSEIFLGECKPVKLDRSINERFMPTRRLNEVGNEEMNFVFKKDNKHLISHEAEDEDRKYLKKDIIDEESLKSKKVFEDLEIKDQEDLENGLIDEKVKEKTHLENQIQSFLKNQSNPSMEIVLKPFQNLDHLNVKNFDQLLDLLYGNYFGESVQSFLIDVMIRSASFSKSNKEYLDHEFENLDPERYTVYRFKTQRKLQHINLQKTLHEDDSSFKLMNPRGDTYPKSTSDQMSLKSNLPKDLLSLKNYKFLSELVLKDSKDLEISKLTELIISIPAKTINSRQYPLQENFIIGSTYDISINMAVDVLKKNLSVVDRLWALGLLQILQSFLPQGQLHPIDLDIEKGFTRGEYELFLSKDLNLQFVNVGRFVEGSISGMIDDIPALADSLARGKLLSEIHMTIQEEKFTPSESFVEIYNTLLLQKSPIPKPISQSLISECFDNMMNRDISTIEKLSIMTISEYLYSEKFGESKEWQKDVFQEHFSNYLTQTKGNSLIQSLLSPFKNFEEVNDTQIERVLQALNHNKFKAPAEAIYLIHTLNISSRYNKKASLYLSKKQEILDNLINFLKNSS